MGASIEQSLVHRTDRKPGHRTGKSVKYPLSRIRSNPLLKGSGDQERLAFALNEATPNVRRTNAVSRANRGRRKRAVCFGVVVRICNSRGAPRLRSVSLVGSKYTKPTETHSSGGSCPRTCFVGHLHSSMRQLRRHCLVACSSDNGALVGCLKTFIQRTDWIPPQQGSGLINTNCNKSEYLSIGFMAVLSPPFDQKCHWALIMETAECRARPWGRSRQRANASP
jgi:hypothetical protein